VAKAAAAGAEVIMPPMDAFWGARYAQVVDPFGHAWSFAHPLQSGQG
jgi:PhnB protein